MTTFPGPFDHKLTAAALHMHDPRYREGRRTFPSYKGDNGFRRQLRRYEGVINGNDDYTREKDVRSWDVD